MITPLRIVRCSCGLPAEEHLTHYIIVRRDLPLGILLAQVTHAAGESFYKLAGIAQRKSSGYFNPQVGGSIPPPGSTFDPGQQRAGPSDGEGGSNPPPGAFNPSETYAIVLGARNEGKLARLLNILNGHQIPHVAVFEPDEPYNGALMAIGLVPTPKQQVMAYIKDFHMLRELGVQNGT